MAQEVQNEKRSMKMSESYQVLLDIVTSYLPQISIKCVVNPEDVTKALNLFENELADINVDSSWVIGEATRLKRKSSLLRIGDIARLDFVNELNAVKVNLEEQIQNSKAEEEENAKHELFSSKCDELASFIADAVKRSILENKDDLYRIFEDSI